MKWTYRILRTIIVSLLTLAVGIPIFLYLVLWLGPIHERIRTVAQNELTQLLGSEVSIARLEIQPFTRLRLNDIAIVENGDTALKAEALNAGISGRNLLRGRIVVTDVELMTPTVRLSRDSMGAPLNVQPIFDRLKGDGSKPPTSFNLAVHTMVLRHGSVSYQVLNRPEKSDGFDANHIEISGLNADLTAPKISNREIRVNIKRFAARERSGLTLQNLAAGVALRDSILSLSGLSLRMNGTHLDFADTDINLKGHDIAKIELLRGSSIYPTDFIAFHKGLEPIPGPVNIEAKVELMRDSLVIRKFDLHTAARELYVNTQANASQSQANARGLNIGVNGPQLAKTINLFKPLNGKTNTLLTNLGDISFSGSVTWSKPQNVSLDGILTTDVGVIDLKAKLRGEKLAGVIDAQHLDLSKILPDKELGTASLGVTFDLGRSSGHAVASVDHIRWRGHSYQDIELQADYLGKAYAATAAIDDSLLRAELTISADLTPGAYAASLDGDIAAFAASDMGILTKYPGYVMSGQIKGNFAGEELWQPTGQLMISNLRFLDSDGNGLREAPITLSSNFNSEIQQIKLRSDIIDADIAGDINLKTIKPTIGNLLADALPQYFAPQAVDSLQPNNFTMKMTVKNDAPLLSFVTLPVQLMYPATISGVLGNDSATLDLNAPYLRKGNSLISYATVSAQLGRDSRLLAGAKMPSKFGDIDLNLGATLADGIGNVSLKFDNNLANRFGGEMKIRVKPLYDGLDANILASTIALGGVDWEIEPAYVGLRNGMAIVHGFGLNRPGQELTINGVASRFPEDRLTVKLDNINVDYIFQTLQLAETLQFGGDATGTVTASALFSSEPILQTENLYVKNLKYGGCVMGNGNLRSRWNNETRGIELYADVDDPAHNGSTTVDGKIYIIDKKLDFRFIANHSPAGFLHTFMKTWASGVGGTATGDLHLFGDFKNVDLEGYAAAENFSLTIGYTGVTYYATDTVRIRPGLIDLSNVIVRDKNGHTGLLRGQLTHEFFKEAKFRFNITELDHMLVLDTHPTPDNDRWYGRIYADGSVEINGVPGQVNILANATTSPGSDFNFALTDAQSATEYTFLTFRDATPTALTDSASIAPGSPELDKHMRARVAREAEQVEASNFRIELQVDVTPAATMNLIMDPNAGDKISGNGSGHIGISYNSTNDEMRLNGEYVIDKGEYNFSLQDIILKKFTIREGSTIKFEGDPMAAQLDIAAAYQVNANLSDLDESFLYDKEVQRTNVPVYAVLNVDGPLQDPHISFDIDLPTLSSDVKRKVKSIISTDDMMNRQIIYLLALNRFYTPEYMAATKGNDLMSVASGTLSSQLSNILGQLSDKISISPSLRTESEDFSDMEFDVALSSTLLNNRLLLNGNFGYRDKALNNNQFIGDFDVEYLLTRRGNWRLKAYNHFNDRNLYVKQALTTQGLGIVFKHDFDTFFKHKKQ
ncbi:MAG: translocation/assembly module TamB domain-containing protein [Bacteroides sp.]|nr:translocation/assembly module TamB domain-containing protein [Bacteroides sp.]MCM1378606.1 translocation/assembly module TamB domain-containing protein [Bacteroides sp.]MCM1444907.1 translocation/assembly module TamB domain-containing protein [Prevotella sp.]